MNTSGLASLTLDTLVSERCWGWMVTVQEEWEVRRGVPVDRPFLVAFFTCIGAVVITVSLNLIVAIT